MDYAGVWPKGRTGASGYLVILEPAPASPFFYALTFRPYRNIEFQKRWKFGRYDHLDFENGSLPLRNPFKSWMKRYGETFHRDPVHNSIRFFEWMVSTSLFRHDVHIDFVTHEHLIWFFKTGIHFSHLPLADGWENSSLQRATQIMARDDAVLADIWHLFGIARYKATTEGKVPPLAWLARQGLDVTLPTDQNDPNLHYDVFPKPNEPPNDQWPIKLANLPDSFAAIPGPMAKYGLQPVPLEGRAAGTKDWTLGD
jgi:hypothetical protein